MNKLQSAIRSDHDANRSERIANAYDEMMADYARPAKRVVMVSTPTTTATDYNAMSESDKALYKTFFEVGGQVAVDAQVATDKRAAETNARIKAIGNERVIYGTNGTKRQRDYGMGYND